VIGGFGDVIAQQWVEGGTPSTHDWSRTLRFSAVGFLFVGPVLGRWFARLDKIVGTRQTLTVGCKKMVVDQVCFAPIFFITLLPILSLSQGVPVAEIPETVKKDYPSVLWANYKIWPAVQLLNFSLVPLHLRVNVANLVAVGWNSYLSWKSHQTSHDQSHDPPRVT
jgi:protein Mpv17